MLRLILMGGASLTLCLGGPARAIDVALIGGVLNSCVLLASPGTMAVAASGTTLASEGALGGLPATLSVIATGSQPTLSFTAPSLTGPVSGATTEIRYQGAVANQAYTSGPSTASTQLIDLLTVNARVISAQGFDTGTYTVTTTVTCGQS